MVPIGVRAGATVGVRVLRAAAIAGTMAIAATAWIGRDLSDLAAQPVVFGLAYLAMALAVTLRFGAIPLHAWAARLTDTVAETTLPLVTAIAPAAFAVVALAWVDASIAPLLVDLGAARTVVLIIAVASILLASLAAWIQDDVEHIVGYSIIGDAGVVLLAVAAVDPETWTPARTWILALIVARAAFAAWAAALRIEAHTGRVDDLRGWALRTPILGVALVVVVLASIGLPGLAAFDARAELVGLALDGPAATVVLLGTLTPLAYYLRLLVVGVERTEGRVERSRWRPSVTRPDGGDLSGWAARAWAGDRSLVATVGTLVLAVLALGVASGAFGAREAAASLPPTLDAVVESFEPDGPAATDPSAPDDGGAGASLQANPTE
jgi:hydrogenase-4 component F